MLVRPMQAGDAAAVAAIYNDGIRGRGATFRTIEVGPEDVAPWVDDAERHPVVVAERDGEVVGWARSGAYSDVPAYGGVGELAIYVGAAARGGGVGRLLMDALSDAMRERGGWKLVAKVFTGNEGSIALLRACGFREVGVHHRHGQLDGEWRHVMVLERSLDGG
jgi:L-amino acid N-acyltransferase YncA